MHIWDEKPLSMLHHRISSKKMDYSHCPLKKRPVHFVKYIKEEMDYGKYAFYFLYLLLLVIILVIIVILFITVSFP